MIAPLTDQDIQAMTVEEIVAHIHDLLAKLVGLIPSDPVTPT